MGKLLGDAVKCYTTPCVQRELKKLGKAFAGAGAPETAAAAAGCCALPSDG